MNWKWNKYLGVYQCGYIVEKSCKGKLHDIKFLWKLVLSNHLVVFPTRWQIYYHNKSRAQSVPAGPTLWNALPKNIRLCATLATFKTNLKTYLFKKAYKVWLCTLLIYLTSDSFLPFTLIFLLYHFIVSVVSVTSHNWMLYSNVVSRLYNCYIFYCIVCFICILCTALENIVVRCYINQ